MCSDEQQVCRTKRIEEEAKDGANENMCRRKPMCSKSIVRVVNTAPFVIFAVVILLNAIASGKCLIVRIILHARNAWIKSNNF